MADISAVLILAGGQSSRMGSAKALLPIKPFDNILSYHLYYAKMLSLPIMIADNDKGFFEQICPPKLHDDSNIIKVHDYIKDAGALSAITAGIQQFCDEFTDVNDIKDRYILVISCDTLIHAMDIHSLLYQKNMYNHQAVYLKDVLSSQDYPLLGLYRCDLLKDLTLYLNHGERGVMRFLKQHDTMTVTMPKQWQTMANFNTPIEYQNALHEYETLCKD